MDDTAQSAMHVLIVHYNTPELTLRLIDRFPLKTPNGRAVTLRVLDNNSTERNLALLRSNLVGRQGVVLEVSEKNLGFGEGMNALARHSVIQPADVVWLLNSDTEPTADCIGLLESELLAGRFAVVSPLIYSGDEVDPRIWYCGGSIKIPELYAPHHFYGCRLADAPDQVFETEFINGAAPMMLASTFRTVGGFPHDYFLYWEDAYFSWKARELGFRLGVVPGAQLWHHVGASSGSGKSQTYYYWTARNRFTFASDVGIQRRRLLFGRGGIESLRPIARSLVLEREDRVGKAAAALRGTVDGIRGRRS